MKVIPDRQIGQILSWLMATVVALVGCRESHSTLDLTPSTVPSGAHSTPLPASHSNRISFQMIEPFVGDFTHHHGESDEYFAILEAIGGGIAAIDYDEDGRFDLIIPGGGDLLPGNRIAPRPTGLFRQRYDEGFVDFSSVLPEIGFFSQGAAAADFDGDGFTDLLITGYGAVQLLRNSGDGTFQDVTSDSRIENNSWGTSAAWGDLNGDGVLDLFVANYLDWSFENNPVCLEQPSNRRDSCGPRSFKPLNDAAFIGSGDGTFQSCHEELGFSPGGKGLGVMLLDLDGDCDLDVYVANDGEPNFIYRNDSGHFTDISVISGADRNEQGRPDGSMGLEAGDFNNDLLPDVWVSNYEKESMALYRSHPEGYYMHVSQQMGIAGIGSEYVGWGICLSDFDGDGDEDAFIATGHANRYSPGAPRYQLPILLENQGNQRFLNVASGAGDYFLATHLARGVAGCDFNNDGRCDLAISHQNEPVRGLQNITAIQSNWLGIRLIGRISPRNPTGARIICEPGNQQQVRFLKAGSSFMSTSDPRILFHLPRTSSQASVEIHWPSGLTQKVMNLATRKYHAIVEPVASETSTNEGNKSSR